MFELQYSLSNGDLSAILQPGLLLAFAVDEDTVGAVQILHPAVIL